MKKYTALLIAGFCLIIIGAVLGYGPLMNYWHDRHTAKVLTVPFATAARIGAPQPRPVTQPISGSPVRIQIPALNIDLSVINGYHNLKNDTWTLTKDKVQYATMTPESNNSGGNTFMYGHNRPGVFNILYRVKPGDEAIITTDNGHVFTYKFRSSYVTNPSDNSLFQYQGPPILTLQTCSGLWYQNRQLFTFDLTDAH